VSLDPQQPSSDAPAPSYGEFAQPQAGNEPLARYADSLRHADEPPPSLASRLVGYVLALAVGAVYGAIGTVAHVSVVAPFGFTVPVGLVIAVTGVAALLLGFRLVFDDRLATLFAAVGVVGVIALFSFPSAGGTVLIGQNTLGIIWTLAPVLIGTIVTAWPKLPPRASRR